MTPPPDAAVAALAEALEPIARDVREWSRIKAVHDINTTGAAKMILAHLPAPWRLVDMDEWRALADEARLVSQWADSLDPMPEVLRGELRDLGTSARRLLDGG